jgi:ADP-heptose:LPS heptosyltransferase
MEKRMDIPLNVVVQPREKQDMPCFVGDAFRVLAPHTGKTADTPRYLITIDSGIGDAIAVGLSVIDQLVQDDPAAFGCMDVLCNERQEEIFRYDPRVNRIISTSLAFCVAPSPLTWYRFFWPERKARPALRFLRNRHYQAVFPSIAAPALFYRLHARIMYPNMWQLARKLFWPYKGEDRSLRKMVRQIVNGYFSIHEDDACLIDIPTLYLSAAEIEKARVIVETIKEQAGVPKRQCRILMVAPDSATLVTRPTTSLLAKGIAGAMERCPELVVCILPSYTDTEASHRLQQELGKNFADRLFTLPAKPGLSLLETAALLSMVDVFVSGDTGVVHLAVAQKRVRPQDEGQVKLENRAGIITLFGGTNPAFYGYPGRARILGRGRQEQQRFRPGFSKVAYNAGDKDWFNHIRPAALSEAIVRLLETH